MILPNVSDSIIELESPVSKKKYMFRRYKAKDEKNLLIAKQSKDETDIFNAIIQNVQSCSLDKTIDFSVIPEFELAWFFIRLRGESVSNIIPMIFTDYEDEKDYQFNVNIADIKINGLIENQDEFIIKITENDGIMMKYPEASLYKDKKFLENSENSYEKLIIKSISKIYTKDSIYNISDYTEDQLIEWINNLPLDIYQKIDSFITKLPTLYYEIVYTNSNNNERRIVLSKLGDFFMLR